jgi:hypothetical protein
MAKKIVKCLYCGVSFDANAEPFKKPRTNRYAHAACYEKNQANKTQEERDYEELVEYIKHLFGSTPNPRVWKQLKEFRDTYNYSYSGICKTLRWWFELKGNSVEKANGGIGIVPYVYDQACDYYYALYLAAISNENKDVAQCVTRVREFIIEPPRFEKPRPRLFNIDDEEGEDE